MAVDLYLIAPILIGGAVLARIAQRYRFPYPIPLILAGIVLGRIIPIGTISGEVIGIDLIAQLTLAAVLFYAGLTMNLRELRFSFTSVILLASLGVMITSIVAGITIAMFSALGVIAYLVGAVLSPTDPAALFSVLETGGVKVKRRLFSILEGEAVFNDATSVILVITVFEPLVIPQLAVSWYIVIEEFLLSIILGVGIGFLVAYMIGHTINRTGEESISILTATSPILAYGLGEIFASFGIHPGALAAVSAGIFMANSRRIWLDPLPQVSMRGVMKNVSFAFEIGVFIFLGAAVDLDYLLANPNILTLGLVTAVLVILVARPIAVFVVTLHDRNMGWKDKFFISWAGIKGVASAALAAIAVSAITHYQIPDFFEIGRTINSIVFVVLMVSLIFQGLTTSFFAKRLELVEETDVAVELTSQRDATRQALLHLVDMYTEGKINIQLYQKLKAELEEEIFTLEDELRRLISEKRAQLHELEVREEILRKKLEYYQSQYEQGKLNEATYEEQRKELEAQIEEINNRIRTLRQGYSVEQSRE